MCLRIIYNPEQKYKPTLQNEKKKILDVDPIWDNEKITRNTV